MLTRQEKFYRVSSLPIREISDVSIYFSALKGLLYARLDLMAIVLKGPPILPPELRVVFDLEFMFVPSEGLSVGIVLITHKYSYSRITRAI